MSEIKCPSCGQVFKVDESGYSAIVQQVRNAEFEQELEKQTKSAVELAESRKDSDFQQKLSEKEQEIAELKHEIEVQMQKNESALTEAVGKKDVEIAQLKADMANKETEKDLAVNEAVSKLKSENDTREEEYKEQLSEKEKEITKLKHTIDSQQQENINAITRAVSKKEVEIAQLKSNIANMDTEKKLAVNEAVSKLKRENDANEKTLNEEISQKDSTILELKNQIELAESKHELALTKAIDEQKTEYEIELKRMDAELEFYKDLKARQTTKMVGESLEQHCESEFNKLRATAFPTAEFGKDNDASSGSKGDYIYRETDSDGIEVISIMFEMKNEQDTTSTKKKNEHFFKELDKDRREKNCEYAVLVSLLEPNNDFYNTGIADVSFHGYEKMYVIRPQFFIQIITILRNASLNSLAYRKELHRIQTRNIDITHFEENLSTFKTSFAKSFKFASDRYSDAIKSIDNAIGELQKIKENLTKSEKHLNTANKKLDGFSVESLTKDNATMTAKFAELADTSGSDNSDNPENSDYSDSSDNSD